MQTAVEGGVAPVCADLRSKRIVYARRERCELRVWSRHGRCAITVLPESQPRRSGLLRFRRFESSKSRGAKREGA